MSGQVLNKSCKGIARTLLCIWDVISVLTRDDLKCTAVLCGDGGSIKVFLIFKQTGDNSSKKFACILTLCWSNESLAMLLEIGVSLPSAIIKSKYEVKQ